MSTGVSGLVKIDLQLLEKQQPNLNLPAGYMPHNFNFSEVLVSGSSGDAKISVVYSGRFNLTGSTALDLRGSLASVMDSGQTNDFNLINGLLIRSLTETSGAFSVVGGGNTAPISTFVSNHGGSVMSGSGGITLLHGGLIYLHSPYNGYTTVSTTADRLNISASAPTEIELRIYGRASQ